MTRTELLDLALAFDADEHAVRSQIAAYLARFGDYGEGAAASLMRVYRGNEWRSPSRGRA